MRVMIIPIININFLPFWSSNLPNQGRTMTAEKVKIPTIVPATVSLPPKVWAYTGRVGSSIYIDKNNKNDITRFKLKVLFQIHFSAAGKALLICSPPYKYRTFSEIRILSMRLLIFISMLLFFLGLLIGRYYGIGRHFF